MILTTHDMDDIEVLCNRVMVIGNGKILSDGPLDELRNRFGQGRLLTVDFVEEKFISPTRTPSWSNKAVTAQNCDSTPTMYSHRIS